MRKQETVSVHQALNKEFLVDDTAIATHQISNKLDQLEKLVKKGESKSGHTLGKQGIAGSFGKSIRMVPGKGMMEPS